ncbi:leucine--tRNA ligase, cytoplasmic-like [Parasteatoda tepidariorum]|nr:leucine--tRNA ligase, cytoplasmic-like [Parasteatoda tepidariorum]
MEILKENLDYLINTLDLEYIICKYTDEAKDSSIEDCCPGDPIIVYSYDPLPEVLLINQQCHNGYFEIKLSVFDGLTVKDLISKTAKNQKIPSSKKVTLYRYEDPVIGPRTIPILGQTEKGKAPIQLSSRFRIDKCSIFVEENEKRHDIGHQMTYVVE